MKQTFSLEQKHSFLNSKPEDSTHPLEKTSDLLILKKQLLETQDSNKQKEDLINALQKQLQQLEQQEHQLETDILQSKLELDTLKLQNTHKLNPPQEQEKSSVEDQNEMDMNAWLNEVQKYNGLPQSAIDSLCAMEYEGNPLDSDICLTCYKEMKSGEMAKYLPCAHLFHMKCIDEHLKISRVCPACMEEVVI